MILIHFEFQPLQIIFEKFPPSDHRFGHEGWANRIRSVSLVQALWHPLEASCVHQAELALVK